MYAEQRIRFKLDCGNIKLICSYDRELSLVGISENKLNM